MKIELPDFETDKVLAQAHIFHNTEVYEDITIGMSPRWTRPFGMLYMAIALRQWRNLYPAVQFYASIGNGQAVDYAGHMGFFQTISERILIGKAPGEAYGNDNYVPITKLNIEDMRTTAIKQQRYLEDGDLVEIEAKRLATVLTQDFNGLNLLTYVLRELIRNVPEHSGTNTIWICGQHWKTGEAEIAIIDEGMGVRNSLELSPSHRPYITSDEEALKLAIKPGVSQAFKLGGKQQSSDVWANSGFGLYTVSNLVQVLGGSFCLASGSQFIKVDEEGRISSGDTWFGGTAVKVTVKKISAKNSDALVQELVKKGEAEAKLIRNAFTKASRPSRGLIRDE